MLPTEHGPAPTSQPTRPVCIGCGKHPDELDEYTDPEIVGDMTPDAYVRAVDGTYNTRNGHFTCTPCYYDPSNPHEFVAP